MLIIEFLSVSSTESTNAGIISVSLASVGTRSFKIIGPVPSARLPVPPFDPSSVIVEGLHQITPAEPGWPPAPVICVPDLGIKCDPAVGSNFNNDPTVAYFKLLVVLDPTLVASPLASLKYPVT